MKTLKELLEGVELPVKVRRDDWASKTTYDEIYYRYNETFYGHTSYGAQVSISVNEKGYELFTEPKPKVMRAQYLVYDASPYNVPYITNQLYKDDAEFLKFHDDGMPFKRLAEIECES